MMICCSRTSWSKVLTMYNPSKWTKKDIRVKPQVPVNRVCDRRLHERVRPGRSPRPVFSQPISVTSGNHSRIRLARKKRRHYRISAYLKYLKEAQWTQLKNRTTFRNSRNNMRTYIGGEWVAPKSGEYFDCISPVDGKSFTKIARSNEATSRRH
jgi:hypothetical protein